MEELATFCIRNDLGWSSAVGESFDEYLELLEQFNESRNLIGDLTRRAIVRKLFIDSVVPTALRPPGGSILDVGTGAGFPGIPIKLLDPGAPLTLVEPRRKRTTFLRIVKNRLDLEDVRIERGRIEEFPAERFEYVVSKAFRPPDEWLPLAAKRVSDSGVVVCMTVRGDRELVEEGARAGDLRVVDSVDDLSTLGVPAPADSERRVVVLERAV